MGQDKPVTSSDRSPEHPVMQITHGQVKSVFLPKRIKGNNLVTRPDVKEAQCKPADQHQVDTSTSKDRWSQVEPIFYTLIIRMDTASCNRDNQSESGK